MSDFPKRNGQTRIETLEELILMSASAIELDVELPEQFALDNSDLEGTDELFHGDTENEFNVQIAQSGVANSKESVDGGNTEQTSEFLQPVAFSNTSAAANSTGSAGTLVDAATTEAPAPYSQYIELNGEDNAAVLEDNGNPLDDLVQLRSTNGTFETIVFRLPTDQLVIDLGSGNDSLVVEGLELGALSADVFIYGQQGDDSINLRSLKTLNDVYVYDVEGDNSLSSVRLEIGGNLYISDGDGDQNASIGGTVTGDVYINSSSGNSEINVGTDRSLGNSGVIGGSVFVDNKGVGSDSVRLTGRIEGDFYIDAGDGDFELTSIFSSVYGSLFTNVDNGDSTFLLGDFDAGQASYFSSGEGDTDTFLTAAIFHDGLTIQNGLGFDKLQVDGTSILAGGRDVPFALRKSGLLTVNNGDGGSLTVLNGAEREFDLNLDEFRLSNGLGTDTIEILLRERDTLNTFYVNNGDGDTTIEIVGSSTLNAATFISGDGTDIFSLDGVDIENDLIIDTGDGERTVDIQNAEIGNIIISGSAAVETVYGDGDDEIFAPIGNNLIDGGAGDDVLVVYEGSSTDYEIQYEPDGRVIVTGPGLDGSTVRNELTNVERILFNDGEILLSDQGVDNPITISGTDADDWIAVPEQGGNVEAGDGDDSIYAPLSDTFNEIDGGLGTDTLIIYEGGRADYYVRRPSSSSFVEIEGPALNGNTNINLLTDVEFILFTDGLVKVEDL